MAQTSGVPAIQGRSGVTEDTVPQAARIAIDDLLEHGAHMRSGQRVLLIAYLDGLYGGDNLVDRQAIQCRCKHKRLARPV